MAFDSFSEFIQMGRHGDYVWSAYGLVVLGLVWLVVNTLSRRRKMMSKLKKRYSKESRN